MKRILLLLILLSTVGFSQWSPPNTAELTYQWHDTTGVCDYWFMSPFRFVQPMSRVPVNMILDDQADIVWYHTNNAWMLDWKIHPNGMMSYNDNYRWYILDSTFNYVDTLRCSTGYLTDPHDLIIREDGSYFLLCMDDTIADLSMMNTTFGSPGDTAAELFYNVVEEYTAQGQYVKRWSTLPYFDVTDADTAFFTIATRMELNHTNSIEMDDQGRMMMSHRANHEITCIDWDSGNILWRFSGPNNQFNIVNDLGVNSQHDARYLSGGRISIFDNGTHHPTPNRYGRGVIYQMDTVNMTATKTWEWGVPAERSTALGSFRVFDNGDALVNLGATTPNTEPLVYFVHEDSSKILEISFKESYWTYRAGCFDIPFQIERPEITCTQNGSQVILGVDAVHPEYLWSTYDTTATIVLADTGRYQVFVPKGIGKVGSPVVHITDLGQACLQVGQELPVPALPPTRIAVYDLYGRQLPDIVPGIVCIELYDDGSTRKVYIAR